MAVNGLGELFCNAPRVRHLTCADPLHIRTRVGSFCETRPWHLCTPGFPCCTVAPPRQAEQCRIQAPQVHTSLSKKRTPCPLLGPSGSSLGFPNLRQNKSDQQLSGNLRLVVEMPEEPCLSGEAPCGRFLELVGSKGATTRQKKFGICNT